MENRSEINQNVEFESEIVKTQSTNWFDMSPETEITSRTSSFSEKTKRKDRDTSADSIVMKT